MHFYSFNIGDYMSHTMHLSPMEDLAYRRCMDIYYLHEKPLPEDKKDVARLVKIAGLKVVSSNDEPKE